MDQRIVTGPLWKTPRSEVDEYHCFSESEPVRIKRKTMSTTSSNISNNEVVAHAKDEPPVVKKKRGRPKKVIPVPQSTSHPPPPPLPQPSPAASPPYSSYPTDAIAVTQVEQSDPPLEVMNDDLDVAMELESEGKNGIEATSQPSHVDMATQTEELRGIDAVMTQCSEIDPAATTDQQKCELSLYVKLALTIEMIEERGEVEGRRYLETTLNSEVVSYDHMSASFAALVSLHKYLRTMKTIDESFIYHTSFNIEVMKEWIENLNRAAGNAVGLVSYQACMEVMQDMAETDRQARQVVEVWRYWRDHMDTATLVLGWMDEILREVKVNDGEKADSLSSL